MVNYCILLHFHFSWFSCKGAEFHPIARNLFYNMLKIPA